ncbi:hypothetical protein FB567DRAFT_612538 [Paraphoma chrysanthemicola]|uniref:Rhodopsin domain-containing protein n=1 Tax=Paraphoma chrysanthemicola TaxID=798071 RepID=A0A8K0QU17_9PLEO|nr:hypothetical protein FB567DRAFT_612538 [Paraphoma chrysanthemicola]
MLNTPIQSIQLFLYTFSLVLATAAIACRLFARRFTRTKLQWNDWLMILAYLHVLGLGVAANIAVVHGEMGAHQSEISRKRLLEVFPLNMKMTIIVPFLLSSSSFLVKMSITHFYIVLFPHTVLTRICKGQLCLLTLCWLGTYSFFLVHMYFGFPSQDRRLIYTIGGSIPFFFTCKPLAYTWNKTIDGSCTDPRDFWLGMSITALFFDLTCVILPIPIVWRLQCSIGKKIRLTLLFGLGLFICIITILRIAKAYTLDFADLTHSAATAVMMHADYYAVVSSHGAQTPL